MKDKTEAYKDLLNLEWREVFFDEGTSNWQESWFLDGQVANVSNTEKGIYLEAGDEFLNDAHHCVLWTNQSFQGDVKIEYEFTRMDNETRCVNIIYVQATGSGEGPYKEDIYDWRSLRQVPAMSMYFKHMNTYHISYAAFENDDEVTPGYIRARRYMCGDLQGTEVEPDYEPDDFFNYGIVHKFVIIKKAQELYYHIESENGEKLCYWKNEEFPGIYNGRIGLRQMFTRKSLYKNFKVSVL